MKQKCCGENCNSSDGRNHSLECSFEHFCAYTSAYRETAEVQAKLKKAYFDGYEVGQISPASAPKGFALVPVVPTHAILDVMFNAGIDRYDGDLTILYRAILAASPTPPVSEDQWSPIETAPRDGSKFLAWRKHATVPLIIRHTSEYDQYENNDGDFVYSLTHWMPLPKAPAMQEDKP